MAKNSGRGSIGSGCDNPAGVAELYEISGSAYPQNTMTCFFTDLC